MLGRNTALEEGTGDALRWNTQASVYVIMTCMFICTYIYIYTHMYTCLCTTINSSLSDYLHHLKEQQCQITQVILLGKDLQHMT